MEATSFTIFNIASEQPCLVCSSAAKYCCITCDFSICNRPDCSEAEHNDEVDGRTANKSVAYCKDCFFRPGEDNGEDEQNYQSESDEYADQVKDIKGEKGKELEENHYG